MWALVSTSVLKPISRIKLEPASALGIIKCCEKLRAAVTQPHPGWSDHRARLAVCPLCIYMMRRTEISMQEHVRLPWATLGKRFLRVHHDICVFYNTARGNWERYGGVPHDYIHAEIRDVRLQVEWRSRSLTMSVDRKNEALRNAISQVFEEFEDDTTLSATLIHRSIFNKGDHLLRTHDDDTRGHATGNTSWKGKGKSAIGEDGGNKGMWHVVPVGSCEHLAAEETGHTEVAPAFGYGGARQASDRNPWCERVAQAIAKVTNQLQKE